MTKRLNSLFLTLMLHLLLASCGGGGGEGGGGTYNPLWIYIDGQSLPAVVLTSTVGGLYQLRGTAYCGSACPSGDAAFGYCPAYSTSLPAPPVNITWTNPVTGVTGQAVHAVIGSCSCLFSYCFTSYSHVWLVYDSIALGNGANLIEAKVTDAAGNAAKDSVSIMRASLYGPTGVTVDTANNELFVATYDPISNAIAVYGRTDSGYATPKRTISGINTGLDSPWSLDMDAAAEILVSNPIGRNYIRVYPRDANGDIASLRVIGGTLSGITHPYGMAVDNVNNEIFVANNSTNAITVYPVTANGDVAPIRTIFGASTGLSYPGSIAVDSVNAEIYVANNPTNSITVYPATANGDVAPTRVITIVPTGLAYINGIALDSVNNELYVANMTSKSVMVYARTANGIVAPVRTISGAATTLSAPQAIAVDSVNNEVFVTDGSFSVDVFPRTANGNVAPIRTLH
jgi:DNA-binding beta-propeller fold protein YncE